MLKGNFKTNEPAGSPSGNKPNKPAGEIRIGTIKATIWARPLEEGVSHNVTFTRIYKSGEEWRRTESFGRDDLLVLAKVADWAHSWIWEQQTAKRTDR